LVVDVPTSGACTLALPSLEVSAVEVTPGQRIQLTGGQFFAIDLEATTTTVPPGQPTIADCPATKSGGPVTLRFVQGDAATDLGTALPNADRALAIDVTVPLGARTGPARIIASGWDSSSPNLRASSELMTVVRAAPAGNPAAVAPSYTG
jgi:hypothetical protein